MFLLRHQSNAKLLARLLILQHVRKQSDGGDNLKLYVSKRKMLQLIDVFVLREKIV